MRPDEQETLCTNWTLIARLKHADDQDAWRDLYNLYRRLILGVAQKSGLRPEEAGEVLQETMAAVSSHIAEFEANPGRGSFRAWLLQMVRWRITDQFRKRLPAASSSIGHRSDDTRATPTVERVPDQEVDLERLCDAEWKHHLLERALKSLQLKVKAEHYQVYHLLTVGEKSSAEVARMLGRNQAQVYLTKHRVGRVLKKIVRQLEEKLG
jgi:RNA polymerase sigma factor (sigma-70 family)